MDNLVLHIQEDFATRTIKFWLFEESNHKKASITYEKDGITSIVIQEAGLMAEHKPFLSLPDYLAKGFIKLIAEKAGDWVKLNQDLLEGQLDKQEAHLEDMRDITFKLLNKILNK